MIDHFCPEINREPSAMRQLCLLNQGVLSEKFAFQYYVNTSDLFPTKLL